jgi:hypothetical protein
MWNFIASAYWALVALDAEKSMGLRETMDELIDWTYKQVCTCQEDIEAVAKQFGGSSRSSFVLASCSEKGAGKKLEAQEKRREKEKKRIEAAKDAVKKAAQDKKEKETVEEFEKEEKTIGQVGLEKKSMDAFKKYREQNEIIEKKTTVSKFDKEELEKRRLAYIAIKKAKFAVMKKKMMERLQKLKEQKGGIKTIEVEITHAYEDLKLKKAKQEEFPDDEELEADVEAQTTKVDTMEETVEEMAEEIEKPKPKKEGEVVKKQTEKEKAISIEQSDALKRIKTKAAEKKAYSTIYIEAKELI